MTSGAGGPGQVRFQIAGDTQAVQRLLRDLPGTPQLTALTVEARGAAELVLAEVLNNIVEHAFRDGSGRIVLDLVLQDTALDVQVCDDGRAMPGLVLPAGTLPALDPQDLPEGGFGWFLIRSLARDLDYRREAGQNRLRFRLALEQPAA